MRTLLTGLLTLLLLALASVEGAEVRELIGKLRDQDSDVRRAAAKQLGELGAEARPAVPDLTRAMRDRDAFVRRFSAEALGNIGREARAAVPALTAAMLDERKEVQIAAVEALIRIGPPSIPALIAAVKDPNKDATVRKKAAQGLGKIGLQARGAVPVLTDVLTGRISNPSTARRKGKNLADDDLRIDAALALGSVARGEDTAAIEALRSFAEGKQRNRALKKAAATSLRKLTGKAPARKKKAND